MIARGVAGPTSACLSATRLAAASTLTSLPSLGRSSTLCLQSSMMIPSRASVQVSSSCRRQAQPPQPPRPQQLSVSLLSIQPVLWLRPSASNVVTSTSASQSVQTWGAATTRASTPPLQAFMTISQMSLSKMHQSASVQVTRVPHHQPQPQPQPELRTVSQFWATRPAQCLWTTERCVAMRTSPCKSAQRLDAALMRATHRSMETSSKTYPLSSRTWLPSAFAQVNAAQAHQRPRQPRLSRHSAPT
mmetsp:Transcript_30322/g.70747  ORF Transcript_30322/g.70747 Transcript_30322/m.70747 type:complete len:246 (-) Transcript_30322:385-1122(-)